MAKTPPFIIGPLLTTFTPPPPCSTPLVKPLDPTETPDGNSFLLYGESCIVTEYQGTITPARSVRSACYPPGYWTQVEPTVTDYFDTRSSTFFAYSPASICPQGWTVACSASIDSRPEYQGVPQLTDFLKPGELMQVCCPPGGLGCQVTDPLSMGCETTFTSASVVGTICTDSGSVGGALSLSGTNVIGLASPIALIHQPNVADVTGFSSGVVHSTGAQDTGVGGNAASGPANTASLSGEAKAGIGVGVSLGVLLLVAVIALFWYRQCHRRRRLADSSTSPTNLPEYKHELGNTQTASKAAQLAKPYEMDDCEPSLSASRRVGSYEVEDNNTMVGSVTWMSPIELESHRGLELDSKTAPIELDNEPISAAKEQLERKPGPSRGNLDTGSTR